MGLSFAALLLSTGSALAVAPDRRVETVVINAVKAALAEHGREAAVRLASEPRLPTDHWERFEVGAVAGPLPRPRLMVPVTAHSAQGRAVSLQVAVELSDRRDAVVYASTLGAGAAVPASALERRIVDLACCAGALVAGPMPADVRLRRAVEAGRPAMQSDFTSAPAIARGDAVSVHATHGVVHLQWQATALSAADIGDRLMVRANSPQGQWRVRVSAPGLAELEEGSR